MAQKEEMKVTEQQLIKNLLQRCGKAEIKENLWKVPEMVGYYNEASIPVGPVPTTDEKVLSVKRVVCSPDLPIPGFPGAPTDQQNVQCQLCSKMFTSKSAYQAHQRTHAKETDDPYTCDICSKTFAVPARLTRHYRTHTGEKPFCCEFCNKSFSVKENLSVHRRIHTKERPYKCDVCSRAFEHSGKLHRHMRIHTGERPHKCTVCSKTFIQSGQLVIHMRTHTGEKPYVCTVCQKGFTCSKQLKVHSRTHTGEKPYSCEICGKSFGYNHVLKLHQVAHYGEKVYKCTICSHTFNSKKCMEAHIKSHSDSAASPLTSSVSSSESSCSSSGGSDKENSKDSAVAAILPDNGPTSYESDIHYYLYRRERLSSPYIVPQNYTHPSAGVELLAAAATAASERAFEEIHRRTPEILYVRTPSYFSAPNMIYDSALNAGDDIRKCVEAALAVEEIASEDDPLSSPLSSNPVSPAPSVSPDPELSLPPRKRSKRILESMESVKDLSPVRYSSVIQYARAS